MIKENAKGHKTRYRVVIYLGKALARKIPLYFSTDLELKNIKAREKKGIKK